MDWADNASDLEQFQRELSANNRLLRLNNLPDNLINCRDCKREIEIERQALEGITRCAECEGYFVKRNRFKGMHYEY